jgi:uncharacterized protein
MKTKRIDTLFEFKIDNAPSGSGEFSGYANAYNNVDSYGDIVAFGAFTDGLASFLQDGFIGGINHDWDHPIGKPVEAMEQAKGLFIRATLSSIDDAQEARTLMQEGILRKMSIGFRTLASEWVDGDGARAYWDSVGYTPTTQDVSAMEKALSYWGELRIIKKAQLLETSPVTMPANTLADIVAVKSDGKQRFATEREFEEFLRDAGFSRKNAQILIRDGYKTLLRDAESGEEPKTEPTVLLADPNEVRQAISSFMASQLVLAGVTV